jgi:hypothetical protein
MTKEDYLEIFVQNPWLFQGGFDLLDPAGLQTYDPETMVCSMHGSA